MSDDHDHDDHHHDHGHSHDAGPDKLTLRVQALEALLVARGVVDPAAIEAVIDTYENKVGPHIGARAVARAWTDPAFKARLLADATTALQELGIGGFQGEHMVAVENTPDIHNVVVCTLCSCYPWPVLGLPPSWYKAMPYRSRIVREPRAVLQEFGVQVPSTTEVRVWDSTADLRYMVLPQRPDSTEGMSEAELANLVSRDSMIGTGVVSVAKATS